MPSFTSLKSAYKYIQQISSMALHDVATQKIYEIMRRFTYDNIYKNEPEEYERTWQLFDSLTVGEISQLNSNEYEVEIYFDTNKITSSLVPGSWNQHADVHGKDTSQYIPLWINTTGTFGGSLYYREPANVTGDTIDEVKQNDILIKGLINELKKNGFIVKKV